MWYCRHEAQFRQALFFSAASVAGAFSGLLAFGIAKMDGIGGLEGWRWIFILEGILTVVVAILAFFTLFDFPETASFLNEEERAFVVYRLKYQGQQKNDNVRVAQDDSFQWKYVKAAFLDWQIYMSILVYWGIVAPLYGISLFLPTIIRGLGFSRAAAQLLTVPIYITASVLAVGTAWVSDRYGRRSPFILVCLGFMAIGFIMCLSTGTPGVVYAGVFIAAAALYPAFPGNITWLSNNLAGSTKRATGQAIQIAMGNLAGAMASNFYRSKDSPRYILGHALELAFICVGILAGLFLVWNYTRINKKREKQMSEGAHNGYTPEELSELGDRAINFRYFL
ncbi:hypothetical protein SLS60_004458 [Paraconiothyrium brasiliense]|uniref:Major facilitator superfamily (MFS) profile domain-containing protein n=1 Tax=Paraconiothyrium brasiliense TaxID=300254 RepID=A0ABR3RM01_9PLEO